MTNARIGSLDGLRGLAILGVVAIHVSQCVPNQPALLRSFALFCSHGVQLFFIVSAVTLCFSVGGSATNQIDLRGFYIRRFFRIAPMFYCAAGFYALYYGLGPRAFAPEGIGIKDFLLTSTFLHGLLPSTINSLVPGGWSISDEVLFYICFPILIALARTPFIALMIVAATWTGAAGLKPILKNALPPYALNDHYLSWYFPSQLFVFAIGIFIYRYVTKVSPNFGKALFLISIIAATGVIFSGSDKALSTFVVGPILGTFVLGTLAWGPSFVTTPALTFLGKISFSLYLVHFAFLDCITWLLPDAASVSGFTIAFFLVLALAAPFATLTYHFIEVPFIQYAKALSIRRERRQTDKMQEV